MRSKLIVMLTYNDKTVTNALEIFNSCSDLPVDYWGFKDHGLSIDKMTELVKAIKPAGKKTCLEVVSYTKQECLAGAKFAVKYKFDYLMGTLFFDEVWEYLRKKDIKYFPFVGNVSGSPSILEGSKESLIEEANNLRELGVDGVDLLAYRYVNDPKQLTVDFLKNCKQPTIIAGSINSLERIKLIGITNPWAFTMGSALFNKIFTPEKSFRENLIKVLELMDTIE